MSSTGYRLDGDTEKLSPHLNHQVRIVGTVNTSSASAAAAAAQTLKVDSVTMVSAKCEPATAAKPQYDYLPSTEKASSTLPGVPPAVG